MAEASGETTPQRPPIPDLPRLPTADQTRNELSRLEKEMEPNKFAVLMAQEWFSARYHLDKNQDKGNVVLNNYVQEHLPVMESFLQNIMNNSATERVYYQALVNVASRQVLREDLMNIKEGSMTEEEIASKLAIAESLEKDATRIDTDSMSFDQLIAQLKKRNQGKVIQEIEKARSVIERSDRTELPTAA